MSDDEREQRTFGLVVAVLADRVRTADLILAIGTRLGEVATGGFGAWT